MTPTTPAELLASARDANPNSPLLTFYDDATGERVELSATTLDNWIAKTANLLGDGLVTEPGERIAIWLPTHWQGAVWMLAAWSAGLVVEFDTPTNCAVVVCGPHNLDAAVETGARDTVALSLRPLGAPFTEPLPAGVTDYGAEVLAYGDHFTPIVPASASDPALVRAGNTMDGAALCAAAHARASELELDSRTRLLTTANPTDESGYLDALLAPLAAHASIVLVRNLVPDRQAQRLAEENVTRTLTT